MSPPPTNIMNHMEDMRSNLQRMQLHNISEEYYEQAMPPQRPSTRPSPKENLVSLSHRISNEDLKCAIQIELRKLITDYDDFISVLQQRSDALEQEYENLQLTEENYQRKYEKAVREMQFFKKKYERLAEEPRSPSIDSTFNTSSSSEISSNYNPPFNVLPPTPSLDRKLQLSRSSSSSTLSSNTSNQNNFQIMSDLSPAPIMPRQRQLSNAEENIRPFLNGRKGSHLESNLTRSPSQMNHTNMSIVQQRKVDPLSFGGSDSFWETISKSSDSSVEKMISNFLRRGGSPNTAKQSTGFKSVKYGYGLIHAVVALKCFSALELLLAQGSNPNAMTLSTSEDDKVTPAYLASSLGWLQGLEALVNAGADLTLARGAGVKNKSALHVAAENCHTTVVEYIVSRTPPKYHSQVDSMGASAIHYAALSGHTDLLSFLIQHCQFQVEQADIRGETALHWASKVGQLETASFLIERCGADFNAYVPKKSSTPFDLAKQGNHKRLLEYYKKIGAMTAKKLEKKKEEEIEPVHLQSALSKNGLFGF